MPDLFHIPEPKLTFGYGQKLQDPRDGLTLFGPFTRTKYKGQVNVGIIGPEQQRQYLKEYLQKIHKPVFSAVADKARPYFPGFETTFGICINFDNLVEVDISRADIDKYLKYTDSHQRVHNLTNLYATPLENYANKEEIPVTVWFVVIPDSIYTFGRPKSKIPSSTDNIKVGLKVKERNLDTGFLFDFMNDNQAKLQEAYEFEVDFHHQLKAKLLAPKIVTQIIRERTIAYHKLWDDDDRIKEEMKFDSAKAWNIATTLYYKVGGTPWKLGDVRDKVCYLGLVYKKTDTREDNSNACCAAQMFLDSGDGMVFRGNLGPWYNPQTKEYHLEKKDSFQLLNQSLEAFKEKSDTGSYPEEVFIHARTNFNDDEWEGFESAASGKTTVVGVKIRDDNTFKIYRDYSYCVPRGTALKLTDKQGYLWTRGFIPRLQTQLGLEVPNPLHIEITRGEMDFKTVCKDILSLTKLNYNACIFADGKPVTLRFADNIGEVLTAGKNLKSEVLTFKHYI